MTKVETSPSVNQDPSIINWTKNFYFQFGFESLNILLIAIFSWAIGVLLTLIKEHKYIISCHKQKKQIIIDEEKTTEIKIVLTNFFESYKAERVILFLNHNGETFFERVCYIKSSAIVEVSKPDKIKISNKFIGVPQSLLFDANTDVTYHEDFLHSYSYGLIMTNKLYSPYSVFLETGDFGYALIKIPNIRDSFSNALGYILLTFEEKEYHEFKNNFIFSDIEKYLLEIIKLISTVNKGGNKIW